MKISVFFTLFCFQVKRTDKETDGKQTKQVMRPIRTVANWKLQ